VIVADYIKLIIKVLNHFENASTIAEFKSFKVPRKVIKEKSLREVYWVGVYLKI
jgi:hypothetical protein